MSCNTTSLKSLIMLVPMLFCAGCVDIMDGGISDPSDSYYYLLCYEVSGDTLTSVCFPTNSHTECIRASDFQNPTLFGDYSSSASCEQDRDGLIDDFLSGRPLGSGGSGSQSPPDSGGGGGKDCELHCLEEVANEQLDAFCRVACCHAINGETTQAKVTCEAGSYMGSSQCNYCN